MQLAVIVGHMTATVKHASLVGWRLLVAQPVGVNGKADGEPQLVVDALGAGVGSRVVISNDGKGARELIGDKKSPVRWFVVGLVEKDGGR